MSWLRWSLLSDWSRAYRDCAQDYPSEPVPVIVTYAVGGAEDLSRHLELRNFAVENYYSFMSAAGSPKDATGKEPVRFDLLQHSLAEIPRLVRFVLATFSRAIKVAGIKPESSWPS